MNSVTIQLDSTAIQRMMQSPDGLVGRDAIRRATSVQLAARQQVGVSSGRLRRSIVKRGPTVNARGGVSILVGSDLGYAKVHHEGRGEVTPVNAKVLHWRVGGVDVFAMRSGPVRPNRYLTDNLKEALQ